MVSPAFHDKMLLLLCILCFNGVFGGGQGIQIAAVSGVEGSEAHNGSLVNHKCRGHGLFDVMSFGAQADGRTDDTRVRSLSLSLSVCVCSME